MIDRDAFLEMLEDIALQGEAEGTISRYSGRAMYGKQCIGFDGPASAEWELALALGARCEEAGIAIGEVPTPRTDSMGHGIIVYWPQFEWPEGRPDPDWDEDDENQPA